MEKNMLVIGKIVYQTEKEPLRILVEINTLGDLKMARDTDRELTQCQMAQITPDNGKIAYQMEKAFIHLLMEKLTRVFGKKVN